MKILGISGSVRADSTNTALLRALALRAPEGVEFAVFQGLDQLPVFNADLEGTETPPAVLRFCEQISLATGLVISSPEYVRSIPGGLKNAIDWLVSREEIIHKPIALIHASHRGDDMLESLRIVLSTVSTEFTQMPFLRIPLMASTPEEITRLLSDAGSVRLLDRFIEQFTSRIQRVND